MLLRHEGFRRLCRARDLLRESREPSPTIEQLAREVRISPFHFIRQFEAVFGVTPHQFRIGSRIDLAKELLAAGEHSVTDVCMEVGFSSLGSFSSLFARRVGETPSAYQRRVRTLLVGLVVSAFRRTAQFRRKPDTTPAIFEKHRRLESATLRLRDGGRTCGSS